MADSDLNPSVVDYKREEFKLEGGGVESRNYNWYVLTDDDERAEPGRVHEDIFPLLFSRSYYGIFLAINDKKIYIRR